jgi:hypothetical protein
MRSACLSTVCGGGQIRGGHGGWCFGPYNTNTGKLIAEAVPIHRGRTSKVIQPTVRDEERRGMAVITAMLLALSFRDTRKGNV